MTLTARQRTKINAALSLIYDNGYDAKGVIDRANGLIHSGQDPRSAYEKALNQFMVSEPALTPVISKVLKLVDASDDRTVDQYDAALSIYVSTGDDKALVGLAPMIAQDSLSLAVRDGEITAKEAASGDLAKALGFEPGEALVAAVTANAQEADTQAQSQAQQWHWSKPDEAPQIGAAPLTESFTNGSQVSLGGGAAGFVARGAQQARARETMQPGSGGYPSADAQAA
jgi:hypothetical protein